MLMIASEDLINDAETYFSFLANNHEQLTYLSGRDIMCPWLTTPNGERVVAYHPFDGKRHKMGYVCWHKGGEVIQIRKENILSFLLNIRQR